MDAETFRLAYPIARRSAEVRSAAAVASGRLCPEDRSDMEQTALLRVWAATSLYRPERGAMSTFVDRIVCYASVSFLRTEDRWADCSSGVPPEEAVDTNRLIDLQIDVQTGISLLSRGTGMSPLG